LFQDQSQEKDLANIKNLRTKMKKDKKNKKDIKVKADEKRYNFRWIAKNNLHERRHGR
jgi:hypothetical protein